MAFVLDASVSAVWALADESDPLAERILANWVNLLEEPEDALVPALWWFEVRNVLVMNEMRKRLTPEESTTFLSVASSFPIKVDDEFNEANIFNLARKYQLSFYDATYLEIALRRHLPLATLDKALRAAALASGVALLA